jgi:hypothetical protein
MQAAQGGHVAVCIEAALGAAYLTAIGQKG